MIVRHEKLLAALLEVDHFVPSSMFANMLECSEKTIRSDIRAINTQFEREELDSRIVGKHGSGIRIAIAGDERIRLELLISNQDVSRQSGSMISRSQALVLLATSPDRYTMDSLARALYTNKQNLRLEMRTWEALLNPFRVSICKKKRLSLMGNESDILSALLMLAYVDAPDALQRTIDKKLIPPDHKTLFDQITSTIEHNHGFRLTGNAHHQLNIIMELAVRRIRAGCSTEPQTGEIFPELLKAREQLQEKLGVKLDKDFLSFLSSSIATCMWQWNEELISSYVPSCEARQLTALFEQKLEARFAVPIDASLHKPLAILMEFSLKHRGLIRPLPCSFPNPNEFIAKYEYMDSFLALASVMCDSPELESMDIHGSDFARISMLLLDYAESIDLQKHYRAGLVVNAGIDQVVYVKHRLRKLLPAIDVASVLSEDDLDPRRKGKHLEDQIDFLIAFAPLEIDFPHIVVSKVVDERDAVRIAAMATQLLDNRAIPADKPDPAAPVVKGRTASDAIRSLYDILQSEDFYRSSYERFERLFSMHYMLKGDLMLLPVFCSDIVRTAIRAYPLACPEIAASQLAVLLVSEDDAENLSFMTRRFKLVADALELAKR